MKTMLTMFGIRSSSVGLATRQTKIDIIAAAIERDRYVHGVKSTCTCSDQRHDMLAGALY